MKATRRFKRPIVRVPPIKNAQNQWVRRNDEKAELFAQHLANIYQTNDINFTIDTTPDYQPEVTIKLFFPLEVAMEIDNNISPKKIPGFDEILPGLLKKLPKKASIVLTYIFNACLRLKHVPRYFKTAQIIMLENPDKPAGHVGSYRPISLLLAISKLFVLLYIFNKECLKKNFFFNLYVGRCLKHRLGQF